MLVFCTTDDDKVFRCRYRLEYNNYAIDNCVLAIVIRIRIPKKNSKNISPIKTL